MDNYFELARSVLSIAIERGYNAADIARVCDVTAVSAGRWIRGDRNITYDKLFLLIRELRLVILLCETEEEENES